MNWGLSFWPVRGPSGRTGASCFWMGRAPPLYLCDERVLLVWPYQSWWRSVREV
ncbi:unnamed protein product [Prunus brigantina]